MSNIINYNPDTGAKLDAGQTVTSKNGSTYTQGKDVSTVSPAPATPWNGTPTVNTPAGTAGSGGAGGLKQGSGLNGATGTAGTAGLSGLLVTVAL